MTITAHTVAARVHGRYLVAAPEGGPARGLLVGFHGYAETAETQLERLRQLSGAGPWLCVAVQALHPFYNTKTNEVVASWMTRLDREHALRDNAAYVAAVLAELPGREGRPLVFVGFSQGVAMAYRAAARAGYPCHGVVAVGGDLPPEIAADPQACLPAALVLRGRRDQWYGEQRWREDLEALARKNVTAQGVEYDGGHEWPADLPELQAFLHARLASG